ncbi:MAG: cupin domain-containing protein [Desulfarculus sp.]|nr:cupin domain-containing protein [Desulfarculus sp.]
MAFWDDLRGLDLAQFRPGVRSRAELGQGLVMACLEIGPGQAGEGHEHPFEQCGVLLSGRIEMFIGDEQRLLTPGEAYFIPAGARHGWRTFEEQARLLDVCAKPAS